MQSWYQLHPFSKCYAISYKINRCVGTTLSFICFIYPHKGNDKFVRVHENHAKKASKEHGSKARSLWTVAMGRLNSDYFNTSLKRSPWHPRTGGGISPRNGMHMGTYTEKNHCECQESNPQLPICNLSLYWQNLQTTAFHFVNVFILKFLQYTD